MLSYSVGFYCVTLSHISPYLSVYLKYIRKSERMLVTTLNIRPCFCLETPFSARNDYGSATAASCITWRLPALALVRIPWASIPNAVGGTVVTVSVCQVACRGFESTRQPRDQREISMSQKINVVRREVR